MASLLRDFDPAAQPGHSGFNAIAAHEARGEHGAGATLDDYRSQFSAPTGFTPEAEDVNLARPTEIVERLVINPDSSSNAEFQNSLTQVQDRSDPRLDVPAVVSGE